MFVSSEADSVMMKNADPGIRGKSISSRGGEGSLGIRGGRSEEGRPVVRQLAVSLQLTIKSRLAI